MIDRLQSIANLHPIPPGRLQSIANLRPSPAGSPLPPVRKDDEAEDHRHTGQAGHLEGLQRVTLTLAFGPSTTWKPNPTTAEVPGPSHSKLTVGPPRPSLATPTATSSTFKCCGHQVSRRGHQPGGSGHSDWTHATLQLIDPDKESPPGCRLERRALSLGQPSRGLCNQLQFFRPRPVRFPALRTMRTARTAAAGYPQAWS